MGSEDDVEFRKSVRNMSLVLAAIVITIFAAIFVPPYVNPVRDVFQPAVSYDSAFGFVMHLQVNTTAVSSGGGVLLTGWVNSSSSSIEDINASNSWALNQGELWGKICTSGWPIGLGLMRGHYTQDNYTSGALVVIPQPLCPVQSATPSDFLLRPHSSEALVTINGTAQIWILQTSLAVGSNTALAHLIPGVYTAVLADEWGDVLTTNFVVA